MIPDDLVPFLGGEVAYLEPFVPDAAVVDIGAHQGAFTLWAAEHDARFIHAFEPLPSNFLRLLHNVADLDNVHLHRTAVGLQDGNCDLVIPECETSGTFVVPGYTYSVMGWESVLELVGPIDVLKVDIEGGEYDLFPGADLSSVERFVIETHAWTVDGERRREGVGVRRGPARRPRAYAELLEWLARTHRLTVEGDDRGGFIVGVRS